MAETEIVAAEYDQFERANEREGKQKLARVVTFSVREYNISGTH